MRAPRLKAPKDWAVAYYHLISRIVDRQFLLRGPEREQFLSLVRLYARFCQIVLMTYAIMGNHFHLLVEVPGKAEELPSDQFLLDQLSLLHNQSYVQQVKEQLEQWPRKKADKLRQRIYAQIRDVSWFMRLVKQTFSQWYNGQHGRKGTLWEERFKSVLIEPNSEALLAVAAYIDLNPVRAGLVKDPKDYRWCGYAEAVAGGKGARAGIAAVVAGPRQAWNRKEESMDFYRLILLLSGGPKAPRGPGARGGKAGQEMDPAEVKEGLASDGRLKFTEVLHCRLRYLTDGLVLGSQAFVESIFQAERWRFGPRRKTGARRLRGLEGTDLFCLRDLQKNVFGSG